MLLFPEHEVWRDLIFLACLVFIGLVPRSGDRFFRAIETFGSRLAQHKRLAIISVFIATIVIRLSLLWLIPVPVPRVGDEFGNLLAADTFAHGRLTNPTHPMWIYFDTAHVNQSPTYMSKYPPGQGLVLALGQLLGHPWIGVLLSVAAMCALTVWMLQAWLPPKWALLGGMLVLWRFGLFTYWMNSYWGGAVAACGGALVMGALPRMLRLWRRQDALILGIGVLILLNSRPFEALFFCLPVFVAIVVRLRRTPTAFWPTILPRVLVPLCILGILGGAFIALYNWRATGNALMTPYVVNNRTYLKGIPLFSWETVGPPMHFSNPQLEEIYNGMYRSIAARRRIAKPYDVLRAMWRSARVIIRFFLWPALSVPALLLLWIIWRSRLRILFAQIAICFVGLTCVVWVFPHFVAPLTATIVALILQGFRYFRLWRFRGQPVGVGFSRVVFLFAVLVPLLDWDLPLVHSQPIDVEYRSVFASQLDKTPGEHLVIVRYLPDHDANHEWVYNGADIDHAKVVWAREIPGVSLKPLLNYFRGRDIWVVEPDASPPRLTRQDSDRLGQ